MEQNAYVKGVPLTKCYLCDAKGEVKLDNLPDRHWGVPGRWSLRQCTNEKCRFVWIDPMPLPEEIHKLYRTYLTHVDVTKKSKALQILDWITLATLPRMYGYPAKPSSRPQRMLASVLNHIGPAREIIGSLVDWIPPIPNGRLLDVGCGAGGFLHTMKKLGWNVAGVEPDPLAADIVRKQGIEVATGSVEDARLPEQQFDVVTLNHVLEHLSHPVRIIAECERILKPGGQLVLVTPNCESMGARRFKKNWLAWDPPRHLFLYSATTIRAVVEKAGLKVDRVFTPARTASMIWRASRCMELYGNIPTGRPGSVPWAIFPALWFQLKQYFRTRYHPVGEEVVAFARRI